MLCQRPHNGSLVRECPWEAPPGLGPAVGLALRGQSRPGMVWELLDPCRCPAVLCMWGREVTLGEPGLWQGTVLAVGLPREPEPWFSGWCFGTALARVPGARRFLGPWCPARGLGRPLVCCRRVGVMPGIACALAMGDG